MTRAKKAPDILRLMEVTDILYGKKDWSSLFKSNIVMKDGKLYLRIGSPGGSHIINNVDMTIIAILDWDMDPQDAIETSRFVHRNCSGMDVEQ
ncbi:gamma-glutamyltransferase [Ruegeria lacuscaerulensis]|uniref:gamma-glutamyltransferase n=1 Tax=Ruegeria lacuscaerulensis TaxID=55218 RepID=UPI001F438986|nr:gamma-glutamyltransferase [Ruegeria lacuscaerulensis]